MMPEVSKWGPWGSCQCGAFGSVRSTLPAFYGKASLGLVLPNYRAYIQVLRKALEGRRKAQNTGG
ncbi:hypothetical protein BC827DRAFT_1225029 [Russula dissimulans]|nr:hypothetical protein BC827DRAFT_1225029 [Russula dissimulans]